MTVYIKKWACVAATAASLFAVLPGCRDKATPEDEDVVANDADDRNYSPLSPRFKPEDVIVRVNGHDITKADYDLWCNLRGQIFCLSQKLPLKGKDEKLDIFLHNSAAAVLQELTRRELLRQAAEKAGVEASEAHIARIKKEFLKRINSPKESFESIKSRLGGRFGQALEDSIRADARDETFLEKWSTNSLTVVTQKEIDDQKVHVANVNKRLEELNAANHRKALEARAEILEKGRSFREVAKEYAELCPEQGERWDVVELDELEATDPFAQWLIVAKVGDISQPMDFDDGLAIVGLVSKEKTDDNAPPGKETYMYEVVRVLFKAYVPLEPPETDKEWREVMLKYRRNEAGKALVDELYNSANIEFPNGNSIFDVKEPPKKTPQKGRKKDATAKDKAKPKTAAKSETAPNLAEKAEKKPVESAAPIRSK